MDTGSWETVYNFRIADFHTYFVGCDEWGFSVWAHNATCAVAETPQARANYEAIFGGKVSLREQYLGRTLGKDSKTGQAVQAEMKKNGDLRTNKTTGDVEIKYTDPVDGKTKWQKLDNTVDMAHTTDAVT